jgi:hypothetical protein
LESYVFSTLPESEQFRLRQHRAAKAARTRAKRREPPKPLVSVPKPRVRPRRPPKKKPRLVPTIKELQDRPFKSLSKKNKRRLHSYRSKKGWRTRKRHDDIFKTDFEEILEVLGELRDAIEMETGGIWRIKKVGTEQQQIAEIRGKDGARISPEMLARLMDNIDPNKLANVPQVLTMVNYRAPAPRKMKVKLTPEQVADYRKRGKPLPKEKPFMEGRKKLMESWTAVDYAEKGNVTWTQTAGTLDNLNYQYLADCITALSFTWFEDEIVRYGKRLEEYNRRKAKRRRKGRK